MYSLSAPIKALSAGINSLYKSSITATGCLAKTKAKFCSRLKPRLLRLSSNVKRCVKDSTTILFNGVFKSTVTLCFLLNKISFSITYLQM